MLKPLPISPDECWQVVVDSLHTEDGHTFEEIEAVVTGAADAAWTTIEDSLNARFGDVTSTGIVTAVVGTLAASFAEAVGVQIADDLGETGTAHTEAVQTRVQTIGATVLGAVLTGARAYGDRQAAQN